MVEYTKEELKKLKAAVLMNNQEETDEPAKVPPHIRHMYRNVLLNTEEGRNVLAHMLMMMGYGTKISHPQEIGIHNVAQGILDILGVGSYDMMIEALSSWAILPPED